MAKKNALGKGMASLIQANSSPAFHPSVAEVATTVEELQVTKGLKRKLSPAETSSEESRPMVAKVQTPVEPPGPVLVDISQVKENPYQPRKIFKENELRELSDSIKENGIIQPLIVTMSDTDNSYILIAGERRLRAAKLAGISKIPVVVKRATDKEKLVWAIIENVQRSDLNCVEEALAYYQLMEDFKLTQEEVAKKVGKERSTVANFLRILKLPRMVLDFLREDVLSFGHAKVLASLKNSDQVKILAQEAVSKFLSVRELESLALETSDEKKRHPSSRNKNPFNEKLDLLKQSLEKRTGFHFHLMLKRSGSGNVVIKFENEEEFNNIYAFLLNKR